MRIAYTREDKFGPSSEEQLEAVRRAGAEGLGGAKPRLYADVARKPSKGALPWSVDEKRDPLPERTALVADLREGDVVVVQAIDRLGVSRRDVHEAMKRIGGKGACVYDADADDMIRCGPEEMRAAAAVERAGSRLERQRAEDMRRAREAMGPAAKGGGRRKWSKQKLEEAKPHWFDLSKTDAEVRAITGIPGRTLHNHFGERGRPLFGREPKSKRKRAGASPGGSKRRRDGA